MRRPSLLLGCLFAPFTVFAHHGAAQFDQTVISLVEGTVTEYKWGNPHVYMAIETTDRQGKHYVQQIEAAPASQLLSRGVTRDLLRAGEHVVMRVNPNHAGPGHTVLAFELTTADGRRFPMTTRALTALGPGESAATSIVGTWAPQPAGFLALAGAMQNWPMTEIAKESMAGKKVAGILSGTVSNTVKCVPQGAPFLMVNPVPIAIAADDKTVRFDIDWADVRRVVYLGATHPVDFKPSLLGHSVGHWEGTALMVDTVGFQPHPDGMGFGFPASKAKHIIERFSLSGDRKHLDYEITIEDPVYLTAPVVYRAQWDYRPELKLSNAACDQTVARRFLDKG